MKYAWITLLVALAAAMSASAQDCTPTTSSPEVDAAGFYVDNDPCQPCGIFSIWIYQESNGYEGLQRGDEVKDDTCNGQIPHDTIIF